MITELDKLIDQFISEQSWKLDDGILKLPEEVGEFADDPTVVEAADILICVLVELRQRGASLTELLAAAHAKMLVNLSRTWGTRPDGTIHHI